MREYTIKIKPVYKIVAFDGNSLVSAYDLVKDERGCWGWNYPIEEEYKTEEEALQGIEKYLTDPKNHSYSFSVLKFFVRDYIYS